MTYDGKIFIHFYKASSLASPSSLLKLLNSVTTDFPLFFFFILFITDSLSYFSLTDIDYCVNHSCSNGGSCVDSISNYSCNCPAGYTGDHCERGKLELVLIIVYII